MTIYDSDLLVSIISFLNILYIYISYTYIYGYEIVNVYFVS